MKKNILLAVLVLFSLNIFAQVGINNTDPKANLDVTASNVATPTATDGILIPRIDNFPAMDPLADQDGMMVFVTGNGLLPKGFYYWDNSISSWESVTGVKYIDELADGKSDSDGSEDGSSIFLGGSAGKNDDASDNRNIGIGFNSLTANTTGSLNLGVGYNSLNANIDGVRNVAIGYRSLANGNANDNIGIGLRALEENLLGYQNIAIGTQALSKNTGNENIGIGYYSLYNNDTANQNIGIGKQTLINNTTGSANLAIGINSLFNNIVGSGNIGIGNGSLQSNTASGNIGIGYASLFFNTTGTNNVALGNNSLYGNTEGNDNTAVGNNALSSNIDGGGNTGVGYSALASNVDGTGNIAVGRSALESNTIGFANVALGDFALGDKTEGFGNVALGAFAGRLNISGDKNVYLGFNAGYDETGNNKLFIENSAADANGALIYGEFDNDLLRFNGHVEMPNTTDASGTAGSGVLEVGGSLRIDGNEVITNTDTPLYLQGGNNGDLVVDSGTLAVIANANRVGVGTTTPDYTFSVIGVANLNEDIATGVALRVNGNEALWFNGTYYSWGFGGSANFFADNVGIGSGQTAPNAALDVTGSIEYTGTITDVSDRRLKENLKPISNTIDRIKKIQGYTYNMIDDTTKKREYGVIAQDVQKVFPEMVSVIDEKGHFGMSYIQLVPVLLEAIKELQTEIETLKTQLKKQNQLEKRLDELEYLMNRESFTSEIEIK